MPLDYSLNRSVDPTSEPLAIIEVKSWLGITTKLDDLLLRNLITTARDKFETDARTQLMTQTWVQKLDRFPSGNSIELVRYPVQTLTSITYLDTNGDSQTWSSASYELDTSRKPSLVYLAFNEIYPTTRTIQNAVTITTVCGFTSIDNVPRYAKQAMLLRIGSMYKDREMTAREEESYFSLVNHDKVRTYP